MATTFEESFNALLEAFLREQLGREDVVLRSYEQTTEERGWGACATCAHTVAVLEFEYSTPQRFYNTYTYDGDFGALIRELSELDARRKASASEPSDA